jgi:hypothetical protein
VLDKTEQVEGVDMIGIDHENLTAHSLRLGRAARALMRKRRVEPLGGRPGWRCCATLLSPGFSAPLLSVHGP